MPRSGPDLEARTQKRVARKYRLLGYDVLENPPAEKLPKFLRDVSPGIVARSQADNVVVEIKRNAALKGSNELVRVAESVAAQPDWRLELVVLDDPQIGAADGGADDFAHVKDMAERAMRSGQHEVAFVFVTAFLVRLAQEIVRSQKIKPKDATDRGLFIDLGFAGVLPDELVHKALQAISARDEFLHGPVKTLNITRNSLTELLDLCDQVRLLA